MNSVDDMKVKKGNIINETATLHTNHHLLCQGNIYTVKMKCTAIPIPRKHLLFVTEFKGRSYISIQFKVVRVRQTLLLLFTK